MRDVSSLDTKVQLFGEWVEFPICVAPTAMQRMAHMEGEKATARGGRGFVITEEVVITLYIYTHSLVPRPLPAFQC